MPKAKIKTELTKSRDTKGTHVYKTDEDGAPIPSLYIKESAFPDGAPEKITINIE